LSENFTDVHDGIGGIAQDANSYITAQRLDLGTTYYLRVDDRHLDGMENQPAKVCGSWREHDQCRLDIYWFR
jgi:hypothetical protein